MILLKKVRLINWYGFANVTAPIGSFTLIAGKNGNGKSVLLDAIKYAAYGDTVFNKSTENKGSRTLSSYTRGLLDATAGTYIRPSEQVPNVYSHIVLEYYDEVEEKPFLLGTVIETTASNNCQTYRYVMDRRTMEEVEHTYVEEGLTLPHSASSLQKTYQLKLMNREQGLRTFMQMTGLKLGTEQIPTFLRKLRGIMSYDPNAKIDRFIRENVLEERNVDFAKLVEAKENIERLNENFEMVEQEITELDEILGEYDAWENEKNRLLADDIRIAYKKILDLRQETERQERDQRRAERRREDLGAELSVLERRQKDVEERLLQARVSLRQLDSSQMIAEEERQLEEGKDQREHLSAECRRLEHFQTVVSEWMGQFGEIGEKVEEKEILSSLCRPEYSVSQKASSVEQFRRQTEEYSDRLAAEISEADGKIREAEKEMDRQQQIVDDCKKHRNNYAQIPDYVGLRAEINREFERRKIPAKSQFACEYVIALKDEEWRDAIEAFLGPRRYTILVPPEYYDIADEVLNRSEHRYAHLFNTKLLMKRKVKTEPDSAVSLLEIRNPVAAKYFDFQLGRMHAVGLSEVREYENAISKEGRVSVAMDSTFLRSDRIRSYYLGQQAYQLNRSRAERELARLKKEREEWQRKQKDRKAQKARLAECLRSFGEYDYDAHGKYQKTSEQIRESEARLKRLKRAQKNNQEFIELNEQVSLLSEELSAIQSEHSEKYREHSEQETVIERCREKREAGAAELAVQEKRLEQYRTEAGALTTSTVEAYEKFLAGDRKGPGGILAEETRRRIARGMDRHQNELISRQARYSVKRPGLSLPRGTEGREEYAARKERIWMDNLQEIRQKLDEQTHRYEDIFKNEFVLSILKSCERARDDLRQINRELARLNFSTKYQFDVHYVHDGSEYAKIIEYAKFLDEREKLGGGSDGQMTLGELTSISNEEGERLEEEMKQLVNRIIERNSEETLARFADYRNYMTYEILISNSVLNRAKLSRQTGFNSGAEVQIPYLLILCSALLIIYNQRVNSTRLVFIDEPFAKMDPGNVKLMLDFMREQNLQVIFCSPDKTESIGSECEVILPALRVSPESMQLGIVQFHEEKAYDGRGV